MLYRLYKSFTGLTIICKQIIVERSLRSIRFTHFGRDDVLGHCFESCYDVKYFVLYKIIKIV